MRGAMAMACCIVLLSCADRPEAAPWRVRFGPVIGSDVITGHAVAGDTAWLATDTDALVRVDLVTGAHARSAIHPLDPGEHTWGLAATDDDRLWLLLGRNVMGELSRDGRIVRRSVLGEPHVGLFGAAGSLVYQVMNFQPPAQALFAGIPGSGAQRAWGDMRTRQMPLMRGAAAALNLVSCGGSAGRVTPCWFPDEAALTLIAASGESTRLTMPDFPTVPREVLLVAENPRRAVRDAFATANDDVWVLGSGETPRGERGHRPGGWLLAQYSPGGRQLRRIALREPARLILGASERACTLLSWNGLIVEVRP